MLEKLSDCNVVELYISNDDIVGFVFEDDVGKRIPLSKGYLINQGLYEDWWQYTDCNKTQVDYSEEENTVYNVEDVVKDRDTSDIIELLLSHEFCNGNLYKKHTGLKLDSEVAIKRFCEESDQHKKVVYLDR